MPTWSDVDRFSRLIFDRFEQRLLQVSMDLRAYPTEARLPFPRPTCGIPEESAYQNSAGSGEIPVFILGRNTLCGQGGINIGIDDEIRTNECNNMAA